MKWALVNRQEEKIKEKTSIVERIQAKIELCDEKITEQNKKEGEV